MDRRRRAAALLGGLPVLVAGFALAAPPPPIKALRWLAPGADHAAILAHEPTECLRRSADPALARSVEIGRAAFRTPILLGGQAARAGLSCESCHLNGRNNPDFLFPGVSGAPGTADVTSSLFSSHRGDGADNPVAIPDLSGPRQKLKVAPADLPGFIHGLVVEEFDGQEPPPAVLAGLADYVRALSPEACPTEVRRAVAVAALMQDARRALAAATNAPDPQTAALMVGAARARLGLIDERYAAPALAPERERLRAADRKLAALAAAFRAKAPDTGAQLARWLANSRVLEAELRRREAESLFDFRNLQAGA